MYTDLHISIGLPFEQTISNYTTRIKSAMYDLHFMKNAQSNRVFVAYQKIKNDVIKKPLPNLDAAAMKYYQTAFTFTEAYADELHNVDIKSAYAAILFNDGFISLDTFSYITTLPKLERLAAVGMLAGRKNIFKFNERGKVVEHTETVSPTSNYFFYAVQKTYDVIDRLKMELNKDFVFSWVDSVYYGNNKNTEHLQRVLLNEFNLNSSYACLNEFELQKKTDNYYLSYKKEGKLKYFNIPFPSNAARQEIYNYLLTKKYNS